MYLGTPWEHDGHTLRTKRKKKKLLSFPFAIENN
jgi:hypothetical protein